MESENVSTKNVIFNQMTPTDMNNRSDVLLCFIKILYWGFGFFLLKSEPFLCIH